MKVKLPAEQENSLKRLAYVKNKDAGVAICENRLQYLVSKGGIIKKGQRLVTDLFAIRSKFRVSHSPFDSTFVATLYTSDPCRIMRYTDHGEILELCKWTADLDSFPTFQQNSGRFEYGFYTEFGLGVG